MTSAPATEIRDVVAGIVTTELGLEPGALRDDDDLRAVQGADSIKVLRLVARIEQRFDIELEDSDVFGVSSIAGIVAVVSSALEAP